MLDQRHRTWVRVYCLLMLLWTGGLRGESVAVISELMFHPAHAERSPEPLEREWLEIYNPSPAEVDASGWRLTRGVDIRFPEGTAIPGNGRLVVAANAEVFREAHPEHTGPLIGGWTGRLSNGGEAVRLVDATGATVDEVEYSDEGDWATRARTSVDAFGRVGWYWDNPADGGGASLEKNVETLRGSFGRNWRPSAVAGGTPGGVNTASGGPETTFIYDVMATPAIPRPGRPIVVTARIDDVRTGSTEQRWRLRWRIDGEASFRSLEMMETSREVFGTPGAPGDRVEVKATLPGQPNRTVIEFFIEAQGAGGNATWPPAVRTSAPGATTPVFAQSANALIQVDDTYDASAPWVPGAQPIYRLVLTAAELEYLRELQTRSSQSNSEATMNATFISLDGTGLEVRWQCGVRNRGYSSRNGPPNNYHVSFPRDARWKGLGSFQLNCRYPFSQVLGTAAYALAGVPVQEAAPVQVRLNGTNYAIPFTPGNSFNAAITHGAYARVETLGDDWADRHFPDDSGGNLYRVDDHTPRNSSVSNDFLYPGSADPDLYDDIYLKQTHQDLNDYSDLAALFDALNNTPAAEFYQRISSHLNLDHWLAYFAIDALMGNMEGGFVSGRTDDFSMYRGVADPRFVLVPHDMDTTFNYGTGGAGNPVTRSLFSYVTSNGGVAGLQRFFEDPDIVREYYAKVLELLDTVFTRQRLDPLIDQLLGGWVDSSTVRTAKTYIDDRRANVLSQIPQTYSLTSNLTETQDGFAVTSTGNAVFSGMFHVARTRSILLNGRPATLSYRASGNTPAGSWRLDTASVPGFPGNGITRVTAEFFDGPDGTGALLHRAGLDVLNAAGGSMMPVSPGGVPLGSTLHVECPATYVPGVPMLVKVERRNVHGEIDRTFREETVTLTASDGLTLRAADGGPAAVTMLNGRGSLLVAVGGGAGSVRTLVEPGGTRQSPNPSAALWKYLDAGGAPSAAWRALLAFDDSAWKPEDAPGAPGQFGAGDDDERTVVANVPSTSSASDPRFTWYFRHRFQVDDVSRLSSASLRMLYDDGAAVYINGTEVARANLPQGATHMTAALGNRSGSAENSFQTFAVPVTALLAGENLIAVELHNARTSATGVSLDLGFDLELRATETVIDPGPFTLTASLGALTAVRAVASMGAPAAITEASGMLAADTTWSGVVLVTGDVTVPAGRTLTIGPGAHVLMMGTTGARDTNGAGLVVQGVLRIDGTEAEPVSVTAVSPEACWGEILLTSGGESVFTHALISRGGHSTGRGHTGRGPMLRIAGASLSMHDCVLSDGPGKAIYTQGNGSLVIRRSHLARCVTGPELGDGMALLLEDSHLTHFLPEYRESDDPDPDDPDDEDCLYIHNGSRRSVIIRGSVLARCGDDVIDALGGPLVVEDCIIRDGWDKGISLLDNDLTLTRTMIIGCDKAVASKSSTAATRTVTLSQCTIVSENHDTTRGPWGYPVDPSNPDPDTPSTGLYTQNKAGQSHAGATLAFEARDCVILAEEPVKVDAPYAAENTTITYSITRSTGQPDAAPWPGAGNLNADPLFVSAGLPAGSFRLQEGSPAIDAGDPATAPDADGSRADMGAVPFGGMPVHTPADLVWQASQSPLHVREHVLIPAGATLTVEPGVSVYFDENRRLTVLGTIRVLGTPDARVTFSHVPGAVASGDADPVTPGIQTGAPKWGGLRIVDSLAHENIVSHATFINAQGTSPDGPENHGSLGIIRSWALCEHLTFAGTRLRMIYGRNCKLTVRHCVFPDVFPPGFGASAYGLEDASQRMKVEFPASDPEVLDNADFFDGFPVGGWWRVYDNDFFGSHGGDDVLDAGSGRWGRTFVLDCRYNRFHGPAGAAHIKVGGDAYIASNRFEGATKDSWATHSGHAGAIAAGAQSADTTLMVARNVFTRVDHAVDLKGGAAAIVEHNTAAALNADYHFLTGPPRPFNQAINTSLVSLFVPEEKPAAVPGFGAYVGFNLVSGAPRLFSGADEDATGRGAITSQIEIHRNLLDRVGEHVIGPSHTGGIIDTRLGINAAGDPGFVDEAAGDFRLQAGSAARGTAPGGIDYGATAPEWAYVTGGPPALTPQSSAAFVIGGPGLVAYQWSLDDGPWSAPVAIGAGGGFPRGAPTIRQSTLVLDALEGGPHTLRVLGLDFAGNWQPGEMAATWSWTVDPALRLVLISEIVADAGGAPDWIELHNAGAADVDLGGWSLGELPGQADFIFAPGTILGAGAYLWLDGSVTGIASDKDGDALYLCEGVIERDSVVFGAQPAGFSLARLGHDRGWGLALPTPGAANQPARLGSPSAVRISEWMAAPGVRFTDDWVELHNPGVLPAALDGLVLTDNRPGRPRAHVIAPLSFIAPGGHAVYRGGGGDSEAADRLPFGLNAMEDRLSLLGADGRVIDEHVFYGQTTGFSQSADETGRPVFNELPTRGFAMAGADPVYVNALAILRGLRLTELMYNARDGNDYDWLELHNAGTAPLDLTGLRFVEGIDFTFPPLLLAPRETVVVVANAGAFRSRYGDGPRVAGVYDGRLDNGGETLALRLAPPFDANVLRFRYEDDWFPETDGAGHALQLAALNTPAGRYAMPSSWIASAAVDGTPGIGSELEVTTYPAWKAFHGVADDHGDDDADSLPTLLEFALGLDPRSGDGLHGAASLPAGALQSDGRFALTFRLPVNEDAAQAHGRPGVRYEVEAGNDLRGWTAIAVKTPAAPWTGSAEVIPGPVDEGYQQVSVIDTAGPPAQPQSHVRLRVTWEP